MGEITRSAIIQGINPAASAISLMILFAVIYVICVFWGLLVPSYSMGTLLRMLLPGYVENSITGFLLGWAESAFYGLTVGYGYAIIYNWTILRFPLKRRSS